MTIQTEYRGFIITFSEQNETWLCELKPESFYSKEKLSEVRKRIDKFLKDESEFKDMDAIIFGNDYRATGFTKVTITSVTDSGEAWVKDAKGNRQKLYKQTSIYKITNRNDHFITLYNENLSKISDLQEANKLITDEKMETIDITKNTIKEK